MNMAAALYLQKKFDQAKAELDEAIRLKPDSANGCLWMGDTLAFTGRTDEAIAEYREGVRRLPEHMKRLAKSR